jgi:hypothetical protein
MGLSNYNKNNQIELLQLTLKKPKSNEVLDLLSVLDQFIIYEDMFETSISARLIFRDQMNLVGSFPIVSGEEVRIRYKTTVYQEVITLDFVVYGLGERGLVNSAENIQINQLMLCTPEVWKAANREADSAYRGTYSDIVGRIIKELESKKKLEREESVGIVEYAAPSINPFQAIKFCASRANSRTASPMFFWETAHGYHFKSLKEIYRATHDKFIYVEDRSVTGAEKDGNKVFNTAYSFEYLESNNRLEQYSANAFGAENFMVDFTNKRIVKLRHSYDDVFGKLDIKLNKFALNDPAKGVRLKDGYLPYRTDLSHLNAFNRLANLSMMDNLKVMISIPGDSRLKAGDVAWMEIPAKVGLDIGVEPHSSGKWLVRSLKHLITKTTYTTVCELTKDSFDADVTKGA